MNKVPAQLSLAERIGAACDAERSGQAHGAIAAEIRLHLDKRRKAAVTQYARGDVAAAKLSASVDEVIRALWGNATARFAQCRNMALVPIGGYGRGTLAPWSDVDFVILQAAKAGDVGPFVEALLYPLWDSGLKVGHAVHTPASAASFAKTDLVAQTAYLDARLLCGDARIFKDFQSRCEALRKSRTRTFMARKVAEREERHAKANQSRFLAEPNIKEGKGGLRDLQTMRWMYKYAYGREIDDAKARKRLLSPADIQALRRCERFLWSVRVQLHGLAARAEEVLTFDVQPQLAERLGYADRSGASAAERLMKHYFLNAMEAGRLTRIFSAKLEAEHAGLSPARLKMIPATLLRDEAGDKANLRLVNGRLHFENVARAQKSAIDFFRMFRAFSKRPDFDFHPDALAAIAQSSALVNSEIRRDPTAARLFVAALTGAKDPVKLLRVMAETGLLGRYIPSFGRIIGRVEYGLYRRYSIDEGVFQSIGVLKEIERGTRAQDHPIATRIVAQCASTAPIYASLLLHETAWSLADPSPAAAEALVSRILKRLAIPAGAIPAAAWCAAHHETMMRTAERRNLADPDSIAKFARLIADRSRLDLLLVVSVCHLRAIGGGAWDEWMRKRLTELYEGAVAWIEGGDQGLADRLDARSAATRKAASRLLSAWPAEDRDKFLSSLSDAMFRSVDAPMIARIADLARAADEEGARAAVSARAAGDEAELIVYADDRPGLLADLAGAVAATGASVRSVQAMTTPSGKAIDIFAVQPLDSASESDALKRLHAALLAAAKVAPKNPAQPARRFGDRRAIFPVKPVVRLDTDVSEDRLIVEAEGRDRPGLLHDVARALSALGVTIVSAHIATYGARAVDAFYLKEASGARIEGGKRLQEIEKRLLDVLGDGAIGRSALTPKP